MSKPTKEWRTTRRGGWHRTEAGYLLTVQPLSAPATRWDWAVFGEDGERVDHGHEAGLIAAWRAADKSLSVLLRRGP